MKGLTVVGHGGVARSAVKKKERKYGSQGLVQKDKNERDKIEGEKKKEKKRESKPVATGIPSPSNGPNLLEFFKNIQRLKSLWLDRPPVSLQVGRKQFPLAQTTIHVLFYFGK